MYDTRTWLVTTFTSSRTHSLTDSIAAGGHGRGWREAQRWQPEKLDDSPPIPTRSAVREKQNTAELRHLGPMPVGPPTTSETQQTPFRKRATK